MSVSVFLWSVVNECVQSPKVMLFTEIKKKTARDGVVESFMITKN